ncbi:HAD-IA family hydrolase [Butyrivibrio sp. INlla16]|uniref:HAD family hydrolase n=1 Tax=Butyrivibrio sp. INlla16 TaxID=1520807 RepID=UPI000883E3E6|nr:HAD-IA family hydrolase [Butyrivibrio sp. INlla16]SDB32051.1 haloacid dehalogenase superfamily, subfamily IA, variant 1 with third motif having Dx(3-4)D or Dx(3-4)E [Butyrivibrio sp. INlla16]
MKMKIYQALVNKIPGIKQRYHSYHDGATGVKKLISWLYLIWLNLGYHVLHIDSLGSIVQAEYYEEKSVPVRISESAQNAEKNPHLTVEQVIDVLKGYDVISFDVFDTLIFRSLSKPTDVFCFVGEKLGMLNFRDIRMEAEFNARLECKKKNGHMEIRFSDIWDRLSADTGLDSEKGMRLEWECELSLCYANPFMLEVWNRLGKLGKKRIIVSDMYLSHDHIETLLEKNGFTGADKIYISCEYGISKADGKLFYLVKKEYSSGKMIHVGDNLISDIKNANKAGIETLLYPIINRNELLYRAQDMSYLVGSAYRGLVNAQIYSCRNVYSMEYEYGYIYGGLFVLGYCAFIHDYYIKENLDKLLFLSRDGDILLKAYKLLYPDDNAEYAFLSRKAVTKLMYDMDRHDYFRRFVFHKVNQGYSINDILGSMELDELAGELPPSINAGDELTDKNSSILRSFIESKWDEVRAVYDSQVRAAGCYYKTKLLGCSRAAAVDIGWAGSGAMALYRLSGEAWNLGCDVRGIVAGTNTVYNAEPDAAEQFLQSGRMVAYLYSQSHNRDLLKKHDPDKGYNVFWELLLSSDTPQFVGFYEGDERKGDEDIYDADMDITLRFGKRDVDPNGVAEIQRGILDFVTQYKEHFAEYPYMFNISGRDAYAPLLAAACKNERYLHEIEKKFELEINVV